MNGHVEENITETMHNDTKVVTKTTTVTETQVITEVSGGKKGDERRSVNGVNGHDVSLNVSTDSASEVVSPDSVTQSENGSVNGVITPEVNGNTVKNDGGKEDDVIQKSPGEINGESIKSPPSTKVKKQKSFKKTLMKKFKKEDKEK